MSKQPHSECLQVPLRLTLILLLLSAAQAEQPGGSSGASEWPTVNDFQGHLSLGYYFSAVRGEEVTVGGEGGVLDGATVGGAIAFGIGGFEVEVQSDGLDPARQNLSLSVKNGVYDGRLTLDNEPPSSIDGEGGSDFSLSNSLRLDGLPAASLSVDRKDRSSGDSSLSLGATVSDSYRDLTQDLESLRWQVGYRLGAVNSTGEETSFRHGGRLRLGAQVHEEQRPEVIFRPALGVRLDWDPRDEGRFRQRYELGVDVDSGDGAESLGLSLAMELDSEESQPSSEQRISYTTELLGPLTVNGEVAFERDPDESQADYRLGVAVELSESVKVSGGYHGRSGSAGTSNGAEASLEYRVGDRVWNLSARGEADLQFPTTGGVDPSSRLSLNLRRRGDPLTASASGYLRFADGEFKGRLQASGEYQLRRSAVGFSGGLLLANDLSADVEVSGRTRIAGAWSLQGSAGFQSKFGDDPGSVYTVGVGVRYDFGGER